MNEIRKTTESIVSNRHEDYDYKRPLIALTCFNILIFIKKFIPNSIFNFIYKISFKAYKILYRYSYLIAGLASKKENKKVLLITDCMKYSLVGWEGMEATYNATKDILESDIQGDIIECGVAEGGSALLLSRLCQEKSNKRSIWLFDSFMGLPEPTNDDFISGKTGFHIRPLPKGSCLGTIESVSELLFIKYKLDKSKINLIKGWFQDTLPIHNDKIDNIAILRLDGDWYESTKCCLEYLYSKVVSGGYVILDDYVSCYGCKKATDEFLNKHSIIVDLQLDGRGGAYFVKP